MFHRELDMIEAIRRDDLAYVLTIRPQARFTHLMFDDTPLLLMNAPSPAMVAAYFGSTKCFNFLYDSESSKYLDQVSFFKMKFLVLFQTTLHSFCSGRWKPHNF
jgi:hypothetical protein